jgi:hypothetical protein
MHHRQGCLGAQCAECNCGFVAPASQLKLCSAVADATRKSEIPI